MAKTIFAKDPVKFIPALAGALKKIPEFEVPKWVGFVKSGVSRERPPVADDFWYIRAASILRQLYIKGVVGVGKLRTRYGSKKDRGGKPDEFRKASGKIIRVILQQAEAAELVEKISRMQYGRRLTQKGRDFLDSIEVPFEDVDRTGWTVRSPLVIEQEVDGDAEEEVEKKLEPSALEKQAPLEAAPLEGKGEEDKSSKDDSSKDYSTEHSGEPEVKDEEEVARASVPSEEGKDGE